MQLPPDVVIRDVVTRYGAQQCLLKSEFGSRPLVLPNGEFFPDRFEKTDRGARRLLERMQRHAGMLDIPVALNVVDGEETGNASCGTGACAPRAANLDMARLEERGDTWGLNLATAELSHPVALTTLLARSLSLVFMVEAMPDGEAVPKPVGVSQDLAAVGLGFGPLLMEGAHIYSKSCGGPSVNKLTELSVGQLSIAVALFAGLGNHDLKRASRALSTTQKASLEQAHAWLEANQDLVLGLRHTPAKLAQGDFLLNEPKHGSFKLFGNKKRSAREDLEAALLSGNLDEHGVAMLAEELGSKEDKAVARNEDEDDLSALVAQSLAESRAG